MEHGDEDPVQWCVIGAITESGACKNMQGREKMYATIVEIIEANGIDIPDNNMGNMWQVSTWQDSLPYNEESKREVVRVVQAAEEAMELQDVT